MRSGFRADRRRANWNIRSKRGLVYFSYSYATFYAMKHKTDDLALIKVNIPQDKLYPEDDFLMLALTGKGVYNQKQLDAVDFERYKYLWKNSLDYMGNVAAHPEDVQILGVKYFNGHLLMMKVDPVISPMNYKIMGQYYNELTEYIYNGGDFREFKHAFAEG